MFQEFKDEVLDPSLQPDINPRYTIRDNNGKVISDNVQIDMKTPVVQNPTPLNRANIRNLQGDLYTQDRYNIPAYSGTAMTLDLPLTSYEAGKVIKIKAPATLTNPTLNVNGLGAKTVNGKIENGYRYILVYNGTSFDKISSDLPIPDTIVITSSGSYYLPAKRYLAIVVGGGGGGGDVDHYYTSDNWGGSGGGGGVGVGIYVSTGQNVSITIGAGGSAGGHEEPGLDGGNTIFGGITAYGGKGGEGGSRSGNLSGEGGTVTNSGNNPSMLGNSDFWTTKGSSGTNGSAFEDGKGKGGYGYYGAEGTFGQGGRGTSWPTKKNHYSNTAGISGAVILYPIGERRE